MPDFATQAVRDEIQKMRDEFDAMRHESEKWVDSWHEFEVATSLRSANYTLVPQDFEQRIANAVLRTICVCPECDGSGYYDHQIGGDGYDDRCCAVVDVECECPECNGYGFVRK